MITKEYWIIDSENREIRVLHLISDQLEDLAKLSGDQELTSPILPNFLTRPSDIFRL